MTFNNQQRRNSPYGSVYPNLGSDNGSIDTTRSVGGSHTRSGGGSTYGGQGQPGAAGSAAPVGDANNGGYQYPALPGYAQNAQQPYRDPNAVKYTGGGSEYGAMGDLYTVVERKKVVMPPQSQQYQQPAAAGGYAGYPQQPRASAGYISQPQQYQQPATTSGYAAPAGSQYEQQQQRRAPAGYAPQPGISGNNYPNARTYGSSSQQPYYAGYPNDGSASDSHGKKRSKDPRRRDSGK